MSEQETTITATVPKPRRYIRAIGRRKTAVAQVHLFPNGEGKITVNEREHSDYFPTQLLQQIIASPMEEIGQREKLDVSIKVAGGGVEGQATAVRHGIARALIELNENFRKPLRKKGMLTRDARKKERKKPGLRGARRAKQWKKR